MAYHRPYVTLAPAESLVFFYSEGRSGRPWIRPIGLCNSRRSSGAWPVSISVWALTGYVMLLSW